MEPRAQPLVRYLLVVEVTEALPGLGHGFDLGAASGTSREVRRELLFACGRKVALQPIHQQWCRLFASHADTSPAMSR
jgi:hypothetical protein